MNHPTLATPATIMVVDNTPANLKLLNDLLQHEGYTVRLFPRGDLALKAAAAHAPDLVLLDIMMPEMDGFEVCQRLKALPHLDDVPVIFVSAIRDAEHKIRAFAHGGVDYVTKPFQEDEVLARVRTHLTLQSLRRRLLQHQASLEQQVRERTAELLRAQRLARVGSWKLDLHTQALTWSPETYRMFGVPDDGMPLTVDHFWAKVHPEDVANVQQTWGTALQARAVYEVEHRINPPAAAQWVRERAEFEFDPDGNLSIVWGTVQDISDVKAHQAELQFVAQHDPLTGLPNWPHFIELLRLCMRQAHTQGQHLAVAYLDLDGFAALDKRLGREAANRVLVEMALRLSGSMRADQFLARIGGDEFALVLPGMKLPEHHLPPVRRLLQTVAEPLSLDGDVLHLTASVGVTMYPQGSDTIEAEQLLRQAGQAMYLAKLAGKNRHHLFDPLKDESTRERFLRLEEIRRGLEQGQMRLHYQPKVWLHNGAVLGFEALIRWQHPERGLLPPGQFIPFLEQHALAITLGDWVIEAALAQLAQWNAQGRRTTISVNVDTEQLHDAGFVERLQRQLAAQPTVQPQQLELEILETGAINSMAKVSALIAQVQRLGVSCALDDFGTGFSSLTFLKQLGAQTIKIDQSFVRGMLDDSEHANIVYSVLGLAHSFERHTLAEGVETLDMGRMLRLMGCEQAQGYAIARPMPVDELMTWWQQWALPSAWQGLQELDPGDMPLLLAEVEHRSWMRQLRACAADPSLGPPPLDEAQSRFTRWLQRPATLQRLGHVPAFLAVQNQHRALLEWAALAWQGLEREHRPPHWDEFDAQSQALQQTLQSLMQGAVTR